MSKLTETILKSLEAHINKPNTRLNEAEEVNNSDDDIMVYMNTWKNYNDYGADLEEYGIKDGWMTPEQGLEFCEKYAEDEPFINDTDNCPIEVSEYDNAPEKLQELIRYNEFEDKKLLKNAMETGMWSTVDEYIDVLERGDYIWFDGVDNDEDLGREWVDMVGFEGVSNIENYFDEDTFRSEIYDDEKDYYMSEHNIKNEEEFEDYASDFEDWLDAIVEDRSENYDGNSEYFDYKKLGEELSYDFTYTSDGAIQLL